MRHENEAHMHGVSLTQLGFQPGTFRYGPETLPLSHDDPYFYPENEEYVYQVSPESPLSFGSNGGKNISVYMNTGVQKLRIINKM
ncbi:hypothetical protein AVEN_193170-1 [Araneus ventricosus]|uniref:Uncharacterized protein n=1 Tax=Araneus ventricosus TaxID=182803 RepID=A0A4Y2B0S0_ARAVE|nr:hypothetical protein AVEN_193170-1 [Araneus ventricosus]